MTETVIEASEVEKKFSHRTIHDGVTFSVFRGECFGLIGGSGTGKSVLLRYLIGLDRPTAGSLKLFGEEVINYREEDWYELRQKISYAFQGGALFDSLTVFENLAFPLNLHSELGYAEVEKRVLHALADFGLSGTEKLLPSRLSGGMQKRLGLARCLMLDPEVILYDEPNAGLDPYNTKRIEEIILKNKERGKTGVLITHDMNLAFNTCDRIGYLQNGKIADICTPKEILKDEKNILNRFCKGEFA